MFIQAVKPSVVEAARRKDQSQKLATQQIKKLNSELQAAIAQLPKVVPIIN